LCVFREADLNDGTTRNSRHIINHKKLTDTESAPVSRENCTNAQLSTGHASPAVVVANDDNVSHLDRRAVNVKNALMRIEAKKPPHQTRNNDVALNARTVFVGNVPLSVTKKVR